MEECNPKIMLQDLVKNTLRSDNQNLVGNEMVDKIGREENIKQEKIERMEK